MKANYKIDEESKTLELSPSENGYNIKFNFNNEFKPLNDNIIIEKDEEIEQTSGGIYLADIAKDKPSTGIVTAVGTGIYNEMTGVTRPLHVKVGDRVLFAKYSGSEIEYGDKTIFILKEKDILSIIE